MEILSSIIPIFAVIAMGVFARWRGLMPDGFLAPANKLTYNIAIPAMMFKAIINSDFYQQFNLMVLLCTLAPLILVFWLSWLTCIVLKVDFKQRGTLIESSFHGNIGYIGLAVVFYTFGQQAFATASILSAFLMIMHNGFAIIALQSYADKKQEKSSKGDILSKIIANPIILTALVGIAFSVAEIPLPVILEKTLGILGKLALPLALLVIGASLNFNQISKRLKPTFISCFFKLLLLPGIGLSLYLFFGLDKQHYLPGLILLASPVATVVFILSSQLDGDPDLAIATISLSTALSAVSVTLWLHLAA